MTSPLPTVEQILLDTIDRVVKLQFSSQAYDLVVLSVTTRYVFHRQVILQNISSHFEAQHYN